MFFDFSSYGSVPKYYVDRRLTRHTRDTHSALTAPQRHTHTHAYQTVENNKKIANLRYNDG